MCEGRLDAPLSASRPRSNAERSSPPRPHGVCPRPLRLPPVSEASPAEMGDRISNDEAAQDIRVRSGPVLAFLVSSLMGRLRI
jgi:hypothetical protein